MLQLLMRQRNTLLVTLIGYHVILVVNTVLYCSYVVQIKQIQYLTMLFHAYYAYVCPKHACTIGSFFLCLKRVLVCLTSNTYNGC